MAAPLPMQKPSLQSREMLHAHGRPAIQRLDGRDPLRLVQGVIETRRNERDQPRTPVEEQGEEQASVERRVAGNVLEPCGAEARLPLRAEHGELPLAFIGRERRLDVLMPVQAVGERDGILHCEARSRSDREMGGPRRRGATFPVPPMLGQVGVRN